MWKNKETMILFKRILFCLPFFLFSQTALSHTHFCPKEEKKVEASLFKAFKEKFIEQLNAHYDNLIKSKNMSEAEKARAMKQYENPNIIVCPNPQNTSKKLFILNTARTGGGIFILLS